MKVFLVLLALLIVSVALYVRTAPTHTRHWHTDPAGARAGRAGGFVLRPDGDADPVIYPQTPKELLTRLDSIIRATPRTRVIAGSVAEGRITYETRSLVWGFPDYTTVATRPAEGGAIALIDARLRFGKSDLGVNRRRVEAWLAALDQG